MIIYIPTSEAESVYELIDKFGENRLPEYLISDLKIQISEQLKSKKNIKSVDIKELVKKCFEDYEHSISGTR